MSAVQRPGHRAPIVEPIEARVLYSADPAPLALAGELPSAIVQLLEPAPPPRETPQAEAASDPVSSAARPPRELVVVDRAVAGAEALLEDIARQQADGRDLTVVTIEAGQDGLAVIARALAQPQAEAPGLSQAGAPAQTTPRFDAVHVFSHAQAGALQLGAAQLDMDLLRSRCDEIAGWSLGLTADADLLLYGCSLAEGASGRELIDALAGLTGADVAASLDRTGAERLGGNWMLELADGAIESRLVPSAQLQRDWMVWLGLSQAPAETLVNESTGGSQRTSATSAGSSIAVNAAGQGVAVWQSDAGGTPVIMARLFDAQTQIAGNDFQVSAAGVTAGEPAVAIDANGHFVITWTAEGADGSGKGVYAALFDAFGTAIRGEFLVPASTAGDQQMPAVAMASTGGFVITWTHANALDGSNDVLALRFDAAGLPVGTVIEAVNLTNDGHQQRSAIAINALDQFVIAWEGQAPTTGWDVYARLFDSDGTGLTGEVMVNSSTTGDQREASVDVDSAGNLLVSWTDAAPVPGSGSSIAVTALNASLQPGALAVQIPAGLNASLSHSRVAAGANGEFVLAWQTDGAAGPDIHLQHFDGSGTALSDSMLVNLTTLGAQSSASLDVAAGVAHVLWSGAGDGDADGVHRTTLTLLPASVHVSAQSGLVTSENGLTTAFSLALAAPPTDTVTIALSVSDPAEAALSLATLTFDSGNWNVAQTVVVTGLDDVVVDGSVAYRIIGQATSNDPAYAAGLRFVIRASNTDNDLHQISVDTTSDAADGDLRSLADLALRPGADGHVSLREAIIAANNTANGAGADRIVFDIAGADPAIVLSGALPAITDALVIDATTDADWAIENAVSVGEIARPVITLSAAPASGAYDGLVLAAGSDGSTVRGLAIGGFDGHGIAIASSGNLVEYNHIGTNRPGTALSANSGNGVHIEGAATDDNRIKHNLIAGNDDGVIVLSGLRNQVVSNLIGTDAAGTGALGNRGEGVQIGTAGTFVGLGLSTVRENVIGANSLGGVRIMGLGNDGNRVQANVIGTDRGGTTDLGNGLQGIVIQSGPSGNLVGGTGVGEGNRIAHSQWEGILLFDPQGATTGNSILGNLVDGAHDALRVRNALGDPYPVANDDLDADDGTNHLQNTPVIAAVTRRDGSTTIEGSLQSEASSDYRIEFFADTTPTPGATGAAEYLGSVWVQTDALGMATFEFTVASPLASGVEVTATATRTSADHATPYDTSALAAAVRVNAAPVFTSPASVTVNENLVTATSVAASDTEDGSTSLVYSITGGADAGRFTINASTGRLDFVTAANYESPRDANADNRYEVVVTVRDTSGAQTALALSIDVLDRNENPVFGGSGSFSVAENTTTVTTVTASDPDRPNQTLSFSIATSGDSRFLSINASTGALRFIAAPDFETPRDSNTNNTYNAVVTVSDGAGGTANRTYTVTVVNTNESPRLSGTTAVTIDEDQVAVAPSDFAIGLSDPDSNPQPIRIQLGATHGTLTLGNRSGLTFEQGDGVEDPAIRFVGSFNAVRTALGSLSFAPDADYNGNAALSVLAVDASNPALQSSGTIAFTLRPVNDLPVVVNQNVIEIISGQTVPVTASALEVGDIESSSSDIRYTLVSTAAFNAVLVDGVEIAPGARFTQADIDAGRVSLRADARSSSSGGFVVSVDDGSGGSIGPLSVTAQVKAPNIAAGTGTPATSTSSGNTSGTGASTAATSAAAAGSGAANGATPGAAAGNGAQAGAAAAKADASGAAAPAQSVVGADGGRGLNTKSLFAAPASALGAGASAGGGSGSASGSGSGSRAAESSTFSRADQMMASSDAAGTRAGGWAASFTRVAAHGETAARGTSAFDPRREFGTMGSAQAASTGAYSRAVAAAVKQQTFREELNRVRENVTERVSIERNFAASSAAVSAGLSLGYLVWLLRGGVLLSSLLASIPVWQSIDPLPILGDSGAARHGGNEDDESLQELLGRAPGARPDPDFAQAANAEAASPDARLQAAIEAEAAFARLPQPPAAGVSPKA